MCRCRPWRSSSCFCTRRRASSTSPPTERWILRGWCVASCCPRQQRHWRHFASLLSCYFRLRPPTTHRRRPPWCVTCRHLITTQTPHFNVTTAVNAICKFYTKLWPESRDALRELSCEALVGLVCVVLEDLGEREELFFLEDAFFWLSASATNVFTDNFARNRFLQAKSTITGNLRHDFNQSFNNVTIPNLFRRLQPFVLYFIVAFKGSWFSGSARVRFEFNESGFFGESRTSFRGESDFLRFKLFFLSQVRFSVATALQGDKILQKKLS